ncbi:hypothetical protein [Streptomyces bambusae]|uniref:Lipoprotein n=1 Tax=Streptomyces bambusae TaxID=1550616 RepID=A0ABS6Z8U0_9ACTN|nr:hypothetical protein [Streptomyces bambusae]MBW5484178.1 hypothetical protein [Streptomyces bambusae]
MTRRTHLRFAAAAMAAVGVACAAGCTPAPLPGVLAMERTETGGARALIAPCAQAVVLDFSVYAKGRTDGLYSWDVTNDAMSGGIASVDLFTAPPGWSVTDSTLTDVQTEGTYKAKFWGSGAGYRALNGELSFTAQQLASLKPGKVLVNKNGKTRTADRSAFLKYDPERCEP